MEAVIESQDFDSISPTWERERSPEERQRFVLDHLASLPDDVE